MTFHGASECKPVVLINEDKEALCRGVDDGAQALVCRGVAVPHFLQHHPQYDHVCDGGMLQKIHLHRQRLCALSGLKTFNETSLLDEREGPA